MELPLWPHQERMIREIVALLYDDVRRVLVSAPTGSGKSRVMRELIKLFIARGPDVKVSLYTNRKSLLTQTSDNLLADKIIHGVRAAGYEEDLSMRIQLSMSPTEHRRSTSGKKNWTIHPANFVIVDEPHMQKGDTFAAILQEHMKQGAYIIGFSATPVGLFDFYDHLLIGAKMSECRQCGAIVPSEFFGPDEPDFREFKEVASKIDAGTDVTAADARKVIMNPTIMGRVWKWYEIINPERRPSILFAPGVNESLWFAQQFVSKGVPAAHIDGNNVWMDGTMYSASPSAREDLIAASKARDILVVCNRFVMREGIDMPWLCHGIIATLFSNIQSYIQSCGRNMRADPDDPTKTHCTHQDHGGHWWRFGSPNADQPWTLEDTASSFAAKRADRIRERKEREAARCPKCGRIVVFASCPCGYDLRGKLHPIPVVSTDGNLGHMTGYHFRPRRPYVRPDGVEKWIKMYHRAKSDSWNATFKQAIALFAYENDFWWPDLSWPLMPIDEHDRYRRVKDVPYDRLVPMPPR